MDYSAATIAQVCYEAHWALRRATLGTEAPHWAEVSPTDRNVCIANVQALQRGNGPLYEDEVSAALVVALAPAKATGQQVAAGALKHIPAEPYPLDEPLNEGPGPDVIYHGCGAVCQTGGCHTAKARRPSLNDSRRSMGLPEYGAQLAPVMFGPRKPQLCDLVHYVPHATPDTARKPHCQAALVTQLYPHAVDGPTVGLAIFVPSGSLLSSGVIFRDGSLQDQGTYDGGERTFVLGEPMPLITCDDLTFSGGSWHWPA